MAARRRTVQSLRLLPSTWGGHYFADFYPVDDLRLIASSIDGDRGGYALASLLFACVGPADSVWTDCTSALDEQALERWISNEGVHVVPQSTFEWGVTADTTTATVRWAKCERISHLARFINEVPIEFDSLGILIHRGQETWLPSSVNEARLVYLSRWDDAKLIVGGQHSFQSFVGSYRTKLQLVLRRYSFTLTIADSEF